MFDASAKNCLADQIKGAIGQAKEEVSLFETTLTQLFDLPARAPTVVICAQAVAWRCHHSLVADAMVARGLTAGYMVSPTRCNPHILTSLGRVGSGRGTCPGED